MPVPYKEGWKSGSWNRLLPALTPLARMLGCNTPNPTLDELQGMIDVAANKAVYTEAQEAFLKATGGKSMSKVHELLRELDRRAGLNRAIPFRSVKNGRVDPASFDGVAFWLGGTVSFMYLRKEQIDLSQLSGARFEKIIVVGGTRTCGSPDDRRHPRIKQIYPVGQEPTERVLLKTWVFGDNGFNPQFVFPELPEKNEDGSNVTLEQMLRYMKETGQFDKHVGKRPVYLPSHPNSLNVPLHFMRVTELDDVYTSQDGGVVDTPRPEHWWSRDVELMNLPSGTLRAWKEARASGLINDNAPIK